MSDRRFYIRQQFVCPKCGYELLWVKRPGTDDSMMLVHDSFDCPDAGKNFYAPVQQLTEIPEGMCG